MSEAFQEEACFLYRLNGVKRPEVLGSLIVIILTGVMITIWLWPHTYQGIYSASDMQEARMVLNELLLNNIDATFDKARMTILVPEDSIQESRVILARMDLQDGIESPSNKNLISKNIPSAKNRIGTSTSKISVWENKWVHEWLEKGIVSIFFIIFLFAISRIFIKLSENSSNNKSYSKIPVGDQLAEEEVKEEGKNQKYNEYLEITSRMAEEDPRLTAQIIKNWVASDGK